MHRRYCRMWRVELALGVVDVVFAPDSVVVAASRAAALGFDHIDVAADVDVDAMELAVGIGDRVALRPLPGCSTPAPPRTGTTDGDDAFWDRAVAAYRRCPGLRVEPWGNSICD